MSNFFWFLSLLAALISGGVIYPQTMEVVAVEQELVTFETATGHQYQLFDAEDWMVGDLAAVIMYNNQTPEDVTDDYFIGARYSGFSR